MSVVVFAKFELLDIIFADPKICLNLGRYDGRTIDTHKINARSRAPQPMQLYCLSFKLANFYNLQFTTKSIQILLSVGPILLVDVGYSGVGVAIFAAIGVGSG